MQGKKECPNCKESVGVRTSICGCSYSFNERKIVVVEVKKITDPSMKGQKICSNCNEKIGARSKVCKLCNYDFEKKEIVTPIVKTPKIYHELKQGRKQCPSCSIIVAAVLKKCFKCEFDFTSVPKKVKEKKEKKVKEVKKAVEVSPEVQEFLDRDMPDSSTQVRMTSKEHAERVLLKGKEKASFLLKTAKMNNNWKHVDWNYVEENLEKS